MIFTISLRKRLKPFHVLWNMKTLIREVYQMTQRWKKALSVMLCAAIITSGGLIAFAEGETEENQPELQQIDQGYGVSETVTAAIAALEDLPELDSLNEQTDADALIAQVKEARAAVEALTEEEKAEARRQAMQKATDEAYRKITQGKNKTKKAETATQSSLF